MNRDKIWHAHSGAVYTVFRMLIVAATLIAKTSHAQDKTTAVDSIFNWTRRDAPGCVCAVSQNGKMLVSRALWH